MTLTSADPSITGGSGLDDAKRLALYRQMVLIRTFEEALLRDYHADKSPVWDIGAGLIPGRCTSPRGRNRWPWACVIT